MIFKPVLLKKVLSGEKTVTRRPATSGCKPCFYKVGHTYSIAPGMGRKAVGKIKVLSVKRMKLVDIPRTDAAKEGFSDRLEFLKYWHNLYGEFDRNQQVWRIEFELVEQYGTVCACCDGSGIKWSDGRE